MRTPRIIAGAILAATVAGLATVTASATPALAGTFTGSLAGAVHDTRGAAVANAEITVYPPDVTGDHVTKVHTDSAGRFKVAGLEKGGYKLEVNLGGWYEWAPGRISSPDDARVYPVVPGRTTSADSIVSAAGVITGKIRTADGGPAAGVRVNADDDSTARTWTTTTAADGTYRLKVGPGSEYVISFQDGNFRQFAPHTIDRDQATRFAVQSGRTVRVDDRLLAAASLTGRLIDAAGAPVAGAQVHFVTMNAEDYATTTDADGRYSFVKQSPGDIKVYFITPDGSRQWAYQAAGYEDAATFTLALGQTTTVDDQLLG